MARLLGPHSIDDLTSTAAHCSVLDMAISNTMSVRDDLIDFGPEHEPNRHRVHPDEQGQHGAYGAQDGVGSTNGRIKVYAKAQRGNNKKHTGENRSREFPFPWREMQRSNMINRG